jgi:hypothetical protein
MNKERIARLLEEPARVAREDLADLRELTERYPWFSGAHLLLAMGENAAGELLFDETLKTTAAHVPSREILYNEVERAKAPEADDVASAKVLSPEASAPDHEELSRRILDQQIIEAAATSAYALQERDRPTRVPEPVEEKAVEVAPQRPEAPPAAPPTSPRRFTEWLESAPVDMVASVPFENPDAMAGGVEDWLREKGADTAPPVAGPGKALPTPELTRDLIDRFLQQSSPQAPRNEFFDPHLAGKRSIEEQLDIVTETLARIHEKQGHWAKAAAAYHRLALKHPQKSGYFAALAKKAEQQLNK